ncbi:hypothetical protein ColTof4_01578 [Colletotrichum tofieldiae]|nr:hypothetical protein ColTof3_10142 [Colletotrichum tofieldiae]GKT69155.1 hypothetical protein ColTof4_01578 [Colletotrichum tofieldiae]
MPVVPLVFCPNCAPDVETSWQVTDLLYARLFSDTINKTGSPAQALQAVRFTLARAVYYDFISTFGPSGTASITNFELVLVPGLFRGYWIVVGVLGSFIVIFIVIGVLFRSTKYSIPDNAWHTIAQVSEGPEFSDILRQARFADDDLVEHFIHGTTPPDKESKGALEAFKGFIVGIGSKVGSLLESRGPTPRFVIREGVFVRASGAGSMPREANNVRRRLHSPGME